MDKKSGNKKQTTRRDLICTVQMDKEIMSRMCLGEIILEKYIYTQRGRHRVRKILERITDN